MDEMDKRYEAWKYSVQSNRDRWISMLIEYCNGKSEGFIRDFATRGGRLLVEDVKKLYGYILHYGYELRRDLYMSIYEYREINGYNNLPNYEMFRYLDKIVFDIDSGDDLEKGLCVARSLKEKILVIEAMPKFLDDRISIFFTGGRGFHVYYIPSGSFYTRKSLKEFCENVFELLGSPEEIDTSLFGDITRDIRIPYTLHPDTGMQMIPVKNGEVVSDILERSGENLTVSKIKRPVKLFGV